VVCQCVVGLCEIVPGFAELHNKDKATLMEAAYFELWLVICLLIVIAAVVDTISRVCSYG